MSSKRRVFIQLLPTSPDGSEPSPLPSGSTMREEEINAISKIKWWLADGVLFSELYAIFTDGKPLCEDDFKKVTGFDPKLDKLVNIGIKCSCDENEPIPPYFTIISASDDSQKEFLMDSRNFLEVYDHCTVKKESLADSYGEQIEILVHFKKLCNPALYNKLHSVEWTFVIAKILVLAIHSWGCTQ